MIFHAQPLRFEFEAKEALRFPRGKAGNTLRGALGGVLPRTLFAPREEEGPSGLKDRPRPFVLRTADLDGRQFEPGERFTVNVNVFGPDLFHEFRTAFGQLSRLGAQRREVELIEAAEAEPVGIDLTAIEEVDAIRLRFLTPMELPFQGTILQQPRFDALFARARSRVAGLCAFYQGGAPVTDYRGLGLRSRKVFMSQARITHDAIERRSSRTGDVHRLGGFVGEAEYEGELGEFVPWLKAAEWTGVGRYTVWGNGALLVTTIARDEVPIEGDSGG